MCIRDRLKTHDEEFGLVKLEPPSGPEHRPESLSELDVRKTVLEDLTLKTIYLSGSLSILDLSRITGLSYEVASELVHRLRAGLFCQVTGMTSNIPQIAITSRRCV